MSEGELKRTWDISQININEQSVQREELLSDNIKKLDGNKMWPILRREKNESIIGYSTPIFDKTIL